MARNIFFEGNLQDGIALAIQQSKMVLAFVADTSDESQEWENELLTNDSLKAPLENYAVALRLPAGSEEAGFLEALFPIPKKPTVVIIQNGTLKEYIQGGTAKGDLVRRITAIISTAQGGQSQQAPAQTSNQPPQPPQAPAPARSTDVDDLYDDYDIPATSSTTTPAAAVAPAPAQATTSQQGQSSQQARRLEVEKKIKEAKDKANKAKAEKEARGKQRRESHGSHDGEPSDPKSPERTYAEEVRQRKIQASEERKRILKRIEDDKRARREREAEEKQARLLLSGAQDDQGSTSQTPTIPLSTRQGGKSHGDQCNLQVRLFDGSTIRSRFGNDATLSNEVRKWIDEARTDGDSPYTFRVVLTPLPNKAIEPGEEAESLSSLGLSPSATLVLVPGRFSTAYARSDNFLWRLIGYLMAFNGVLLRLLVNLQGQMMDIVSGRQAPEQPAAAEEIPLRNLGNTRIQGFRNQEDQRRDAQLYNGNSLNFEPRRDDEDEDTGNGK